MPQTATGQASRLESILESAADAIITIDEAGIVETANPAAARLFGYDRSEFAGRNVRFLMPEPYSSEHDGYIRNYRATGHKKIIGIGRRVVGRRSDGSTFPMHLSVSEFHIGERVFFTGIIHDLTEQADAERAVVHAQKMEAIGQLTGGIAHDFNNLLTAIVGNLEILDTRLADESQRVFVREALDAAEVASRLTSRLLTFARRAPLEPRVVNLSDLVAGLQDMLRRTVGEMIVVATSSAEGLWVTRVDPSQVESAVVNLVVNARDAMPNGGQLVIETSNVTIDADATTPDIGPPPGDYVQLAVSDNGSGMPASVRERAFEPFFTTKEQGKGTGLGLAMIYGFAKQSGGQATIYSEEGVGTTVRIYLPRHHPQAAVEAGAAPEAGPARGRGELVLVVEDDPRVRRLTVARLNELGYRVVEAANGGEAMTVLESMPEIALVFSDLIMPDMSGRDLAAHVRQSYPEICLLLTSGYSEDFANSSMPGERLPLLRKPYRLVELAEAVRSALGD